MAEVTNSSSITKTFANDLEDKIKNNSNGIIQEETKYMQDILKEGEDVLKVTNTYTEYNSKINK